MKILILRSTLASGIHLEAGTVQDVSDDDGALLVRLGRATTKLPPSARACARYTTWPRCSTSKTPLVKTQGRGKAASRSAQPLASTSLCKKAGCALALSAGVWSATGFMQRRADPLWH